MKLGSRVARLHQVPTLKAALRTSIDQSHYLLVLPTLCSTTFSTFSTFKDSATPSSTIDRTQLTSHAPTMQPPAVSALLFLSLAHLTASAPAPQNNDYPLVEFIGRGQLRTISVGLAGPRYQDVGCLNSLGQWTTDEPQCGVFQAVRPAQNNISLSALPDGWNCGIDHVKFRCGADVGATIFGVCSCSLSIGSPMLFPGRVHENHEQGGIYTRG